MREDARSSQPRPPSGVPRDTPGLELPQEAPSAGWQQQQKAAPEVISRSPVNPSQDQAALGSMQALGFSPVPKRKEPAGSPFSFPASIR